MGTSCLFLLVFYGLWQKLDTFFIWAFLHVEEPLSPLLLFPLFIIHAGISSLPWLIVLASNELQTLSTDSMVQ